MMSSVLVDDGRMLEVPKVKHSYAPVSSDGRKHVSASTGATEGNVVYLITDEK